jgi:chromosome segregation ATPase
MIEPIMYFGIGFLVAALIGLVIVPLVHGRAVRLTMRRLEAATPLSMAEIQADKDQLRAEFAMSTRRLEMSVETLKTKSTSQLAELGKKSDAINRLKAEIGEKSATIFALEARDKALRDQVRATEEEFGVKTETVHAAERALADKQAELSKVVDALDERSTLADAQKIELVALRTQVEALKERLTDAGHELKTTEQRMEAERIELKSAADELQAERDKANNLGVRVEELQRHLVAQTTEAEILGRRAQDLETKLSEQARILATSENQMKHMREEVEAARKTEIDLRSAIAEIDGRSSSQTDVLKAEKAQLQAQLDRVTEDRDRLQKEIGQIRRETEQAWTSERVENSLLRERINDVAAEVARLASALEGPNSPIDAILAAETVNDVSGTLQTGKIASEPATGSGNLADRIRALQSAASRLPQGDPTTRN